MSVVFKLEKVIEVERKKRMEIDEKVNVLVAELEREKAEVEARNLREEIDRLKGKVEVRKEVNVRPKIRIEGGSSKNTIEQIGLNN